MFTAADYREIISGRKNGWWAVAVRSALSLAEPIYGCGIRYRNRRYARGSAAIHRVSVPVISVGNITTGGTGKTPFVAWIADWLRQRQRQVVLVSRGYGSRRGIPNDEALELAALLPDVPHLQDPDRVAAARQAEEQLRGEVILLDDAFQHRRLHRDLDIVLIDALQPFGFDRLLPRGLLREPLSSLRRADVIALSRADLVTDEQRCTIARRIRELAPQTLLVELAHRPRSLWNANGESLDPRMLRDQRIAAFCGLGNPQGFRETLVRCGAKISDFREFSDHFRFRSEDVKALTEWTERLDIEQVLCTMKDIVKLRVTTLGRHPLRALTIGIEFLSEREEFESRLHSVVARDASGS